MRRRICVIVCVCVCAIHLRHSGTGLQFPLRVCLCVCVRVCVRVYSSCSYCPFMIQTATNLALRPWSTHIHSVVVGHTHTHPRSHMHSVASEYSHTHTPNILLVF